MSNGDGTSLASKAPVSGKPLSTGERTLAVLLGAAITGAGVAAIFVKNNGPGALALIVVGAVFLLVGITGVIVTSLKVGGNEVVLERVREAQAAFAQGDSKRATAIVQELASPTSPSMTLVPEALERSRYEKSVMDVLGSSLPSDWRIEEDKEAADYRFDAYLQSGSGKAIICEIFVTSGFTGGQLSRSLENARNNNELRVDGVLVVSRYDTKALQSLRSKMEKLKMPIQIVSWSGDNSSEELRSSVAELIRMLEGSSGAS
jgi:hypothetical protein